METPHINVLSDLERVTVFDNGVGPWTLGGAAICLERLVGGDERQLRKAGSVRVFVQGRGPRAEDQDQAGLILGVCCSRSRTQSDLWTHEFLVTPGMVVVVMRRDQRGSLISKHKPRATSHDHPHSTRQTFRLVTHLHVVLLERLANLVGVVRVDDSGGVRRIVDDEVHPVIRPGLVWQDLHR
jgi:hypothetical protein